MLSDHLGLISTFDLSADSASTARCVFPGAKLQSHRALQIVRQCGCNCNLLRLALAARMQVLHLSDLQSEAFVICRLPGDSVLSERARESASLFSAALEQLNSGA